MDSPTEPGSSTNLQWENVGLGLCFILFDAGISHFLKLGVGTSLVTAAARCVIQLTLVSVILEKVFKTNHPAAVAGIAVLLNLLGAFETVANKCKQRYSGMFTIVICSMLFSTIPISILGIRFAMGISPFWQPEQYIPIVGMLCGSLISNIVVSLSYVLKELEENRDKTETYLAYGASRFEAAKPIAKSALRLALTPTINQMSVLGIISIPGMMTGAILGGSSVVQAARLQMVIMFMISACSALATIISTVGTLAICIDGEHRIRFERIDSRPHAVWRAVSAFGRGCKSLVWGTAGKVTAAIPHEHVPERRERDGEREPLLGQGVQP
ncbi:UPF0014-domain-containing protein [Vararia minispora EC-137]|uniref:UPF0014-domain-containing protein n=1 Tax=Vararia minispora EC-137 TaxID=1314806 RepID=A0ACB8QSA3_9AGAM|nr:UPF0014-domain-containing protein [Vararia minispora EC-137]